MVSIIMGSSSDLEIMQAACDVFEEFGITYEKKVISAHRAPNLLHEYLASAVEGGSKIFIAGAGKAAHLPGVIASLTDRPVIGVPIKTSDLGGMDSLLSIVQMPTGVPVATVAINGAKNAGLLAVQMLALSDESLRNKMLAYRVCMEKELRDLNDR